MKIAYKNNTTERVLMGIQAVASLIVIVSFALRFGFYEPLLGGRFLIGVLATMLAVFVGSKTIQLLNCVSRREYLVANWYEIPMLLALAIATVGAGRWFAQTNPVHVRHWALGLYLLVSVTIKFFMMSVRLAAGGRSPTRTWVGGFVVLIVTGAALLMLPRATQGRESLSAVDAIFTATSATCVTGLVVKDTGNDFTLMGQLVVLSLIQLGGLGIVLFGAVLALLLGQALSVRESAAMQDLLSEATLGRIGKMVVFVFITTAVFELTGAMAMLHMWEAAPGQPLDIHQRWYLSIFHAISAFCNAGFCLFNDNLIGYRQSWGVYLVICPLIVSGGLGFGVLYDVGAVAVDRISRLCKRLGSRYPVYQQAPKRVRLQTKIVLSVSALLIAGGMLALFALERLTRQVPNGGSFTMLDGFFQSVTARTAGFCTVDIGVLSDASKLILVLLMFVGGSPGGTAGGVKTVTMLVVVMAVVSTLRRREEVEVFRRSLRLMIVRRAVTVVVLFAATLFAATLILCVTEASNHFTIMQVFFEVASAMGTVGLSTGITPSLTAAGKLVIIAVMLVGRLGPLTLLAAMTFNQKPLRYNYPEEAVVVG